jgi:hypothetical protein
MLKIMTIMLVFASASVSAFAAELTARQIMERAQEAQGGRDWADVKTLYLKGHGIFYSNGTQENPVIAESYTMWREMDQNRSAAHGPDGKVKIIALAKGKRFIAVSYDGVDTYTGDGKMPADKAAAYWASNFGFGIIRQALKPEFTLVRLPDDIIDGHKSYMVKIIDPQKQETLFGLDAKTFAIRKAAFNTPKGWHERIYDRFFINKRPRWLQAGHIRLYYNGVKANELFWQEIKVNPPLPPETFRLETSVK